MVIKTKTKEFPIVWDGTSSIDNLLRVQTMGGVMGEILPVFMDAEETSLLEVSDSYETIRSYSGYTDFYGIIKNRQGYVITLGKEETT